MTDEMIEILCISKTLVGPDVGAIQHEILRYYPEEYNEDLFNEQRLNTLNSGGFFIKESWNKEYQCGYCLVTGWTNEQIHTKAGEIASVMT